MQGGNRRKPGVTGNRAVDISVLLERVLDQSKVSENMHFQVLQEHFLEVVGPLVFPHVSLVKLERRVLVLKAHSSTWKSELNLQKNAIITKCNALLGKPFVQSIRFA